MTGDRLPPEETRGGEKPGDWKVAPVIFQGPAVAQHTYTTECDGFHESGPCPDRDGE